MVEQNEKNDFFKWISNQSSIDEDIDYEYVNKLLKIVEKYAVKKGLLSRPLYETLDVAIVRNISDKIAVDRQFEIRNFFNIKKIRKWMNLYLIYLQEECGKRERDCLNRINNYDNEFNKNNGLSGKNECNSIDNDDVNPEMQVLYVTDNETVVETDEAVDIGTEVTEAVAETVEVVDIGTEVTEAVAETVEAVDIDTEVTEVVAETDEAVEIGTEVTEAVAETVEAVDIDTEVTEAVVETDEEVDIGTKVIDYELNSANNFEMKDKKHVHILFTDDSEAENDNLEINSGRRGYQEFLKKNIKSEFMRSMYQHELDHSESIMQENEIGTGTLYNVKTLDEGLNNINLIMNHSAFIEYNKKVLSPKPASAIKNYRNYLKLRQWNQIKLVKEESNNIKEKENQQEENYYGNLLIEDKVEQIEENVNIRVCHIDKVGFSRYLDEKKDFKNFTKKEYMTFIVICESYVWSNKIGSGSLYGNIMEYEKILNNINIVLKNKMFQELNRKKRNGLCATLNKYSKYIYQLIEDNNITKESDSLTKEIVVADNEAKGISSKKIDLGRENFFEYLNEINLGTPEIRISYANKIIACEVFAEIHQIGKGLYEADCLENALETAKLLLESKLFDTYSSKQNTIPIKALNAYIDFLYHLHNEDGKGVVFLPTRQKRIENEAVSENNGPLEYQKEESNKKILNRECVESYSNQCEKAQEDYRKVLNRDISDKDLMIGNVQQTLDEDTANTDINVISEIIESTIEDSEEQKLNEILIYLEELYRDNPAESLQTIYLAVSDAREVERLIYATYGVEAKTWFIEKGLLLSDKQKLMKLENILKSRYSVRKANSIKDLYEENPDINPMWFIELPHAVYGKNPTAYFEEIGILKVSEFDWIQNQVNEKISAEKNNVFNEKLLCQEDGEAINQEDDEQRIVVNGGKSSHCLMELITKDEKEEKYLPTDIDKKVVSKDNCQQGFTEEEALFVESCTKGVYFGFEEMKRAFRRQFPNRCDDIFTPSNLMDIGYRYLKNNLVVLNEISSVEELIDRLFLKNRVVDFSENEWLLKHSGVYTILSQMKRSYSIVEFEKNKFVNICEFNKSGMNRALLEDYCEQVKTYIKKKPFSVFYLQSSGFKHALDDFGFETYFYESVLKNNSAFKSTRYKGQILFKQTNEKISFSDLIVEIIEREGTMDIYDIQQLLVDEYGIKIDLYNIRNFAKEGDLYYSDTMEKIYLDYDDFFEEI